MSKKKKQRIVDPIICEIPIQAFSVLFGTTQHDRLIVFRCKGFECRRCGRKADRIRYSFDRDFAEGSLHIDIYAGDVMMTVDHIIPKAKGGSDKIENKEPMCGPCNWNVKGSKLDAELGL